MCCLPPEGERRPTKHADFGAQSHSALFPNCLHLKNNVTAIPPKLATSDAATSYWMRFPLINLYTLLGVPFVLLIHSWVLLMLLLQDLCPIKNVNAATGSTLSYMIAFLFHSTYLADAILLTVLPCLSGYKATVSVDIRHHLESVVIHAFG